MITGMEGKKSIRESVNPNPIDLLVSILLFIRANKESLTKQKRVLATLPPWWNVENKARPLTLKARIALLEEYTTPNHSMKP